MARLVGSAIARKMSTCLRQVCMPDLLSPQEAGPWMTSSAMFSVVSVSAQAFLRLGRPRLRFFFTVRLLSLFVHPTTCG